MSLLVRCGYEVQIKKKNVFERKSIFKTCTL